MVIVVDYVILLVCFVAFGDCSSPKACVLVHMYFEYTIGASVSEPLHDINGSGSCPSIIYTYTTDWSLNFPTAHCATNSASSHVLCYMILARVLLYPRSYSHIHVWYPPLSAFTRNAHRIFNLPPVNTLFFDNAAPDSCCAKRPLHVPTYPRLVSRYLPQPRF